MKMTMEIPAADHDLVGISRADYKQFWTAEDEFNGRYIRVQNWFIVFTCLVFDIQLFMVSFDVDFVVYIAFQIFHALNGNFFTWNFLYTIYTGALVHPVIFSQNQIQISYFNLVNVFYIECLLFMFKKFRHISQQVQGLGKAKPVNNRSLARLIFEYNRMNAELVEFNDFFKDFLGHNVVHFFGLAVFLSFIGSILNLLSSKI